MPPSATEQIQRVETLNRRLAHLERRLLPLFETSKQPHPTELHLRYPQLSRFEDFNKDAEITLFFREANLTYTPDDELLGHSAYPQGHGASRHDLC